MESLAPVYTAELFAPLHTELIRLLRHLSESEWERPTVAGSWRVRDVAGHLLDIDLRKLAGGRDGHRPSARPASSSFADIVDFINTLNASGVSYAERLSPGVMTDLLEVTGRWVSEFVASLDPHADARIAVAWADEDRSTNWMDTGREYTERWHHQMQIRDAVGASSLLQRPWLYPMLDLSVRAFRRAYKDVPAAVGTAVLFEVDAEGESVWSVIREQTGWVVRRGAARGAAAWVRADADTAWRLLFNALSPEAARARIATGGEATLVEPIFSARAVMV